MKSSYAAKVMSMRCIRVLQEYDLSSDRGGTMGHRAGALGFFKLLNKLFCHSLLTFRVQTQEQYGF